MITYAQVGYDSISLLPFLRSEPATSESEPLIPTDAPRPTSRFGILGIFQGNVVYRDTTVSLFGLKTC